MLAVAAALASLVLLAGAGDEAPSVLVQMVRLQRGSLPETVTAYGTAGADPSARTTVTAPLAAVVGNVYVRAGQEVEEGAPLVKLVPNPQTSSSYQQAVSALQNASQLVGHTQELYKQFLATKQDLANAQRAEADARAGLAALRAQGAQGPRTVTAPFHAIVTNLPASVGATVDIGTALLDLAPPNSLVLRVGVVPDQAARIKPGDTAVITPVGVNRTYNGKVVLRGAMVESGNGLVPIDISLPPAALLPGQTAQASITTGIMPGYVVPHEAILVDDSGATYVVQAVHMMAKIVPVRVLGSHGNKDVVAGKLDISAPLVLAGNYQLKDGMTVRLTDPKGDSLMFVRLIEHHRKALLCVAFALALAGLFVGIGAAGGPVPRHQLPAHPHRGRCRQHAGQADADRRDRAAGGGRPRGARRCRCGLDHLARIGGNLRRFPLGLRHEPGAFARRSAFAQKLPDLPAGHDLRRHPDEPDDHHAVRLLCAHLRQGLAGRSASGWRSTRSCRCSPASRASGGWACWAARRRRCRSTVEPAEARRLWPDAERRRQGDFRQPIRSAPWAGCEDNDLLYLVIDNNAFTSVEVGGATWRCRPGNGGIIRLSDLAKVQDGRGAAMAAGRRQRQAGRHTSTSISRTAPTRSPWRRRSTRGSTDFMKTQPKSIHLRQMVRPDRSSCAPRSARSRRRS